jgi:signal transduction histidine kinase
LEVSFSPIFNAGLNYARTASEKRCIFLTNQISLILSGFSFILFITYFAWYGWNFITIAIPVVGIFFLLPIMLNTWGYFISSRLLVCLSIPIISMGISIYAKSIYINDQQELDYFTFRFLILASCVFPFILFTLNETRLLVTSAIIGLATLMLHDPLHYFFGVGYIQTKLTSASLNKSAYYFVNVVILITYFIMVGAIVFLKWISEKNEYKNTLLITELNAANESLKEKNSEIESQSFELLAQSEVLSTNQQKLLETYAEIERHKNLLFKENENLSAELLDKNKDLIETNNELAKHNTELRQFSYTVSHNLRGPVASLLGLLSLIEFDTLDENNKKIITFLKTSIYQLDIIIHDLSKIIDIRNDIFKIRQKIDLIKEIEDIKKILSKEIESHHIKFSYDINTEEALYSVRPMIHSILFNLISNSIKYRSMDRTTEIQIKARHTANYFVLSIKDNGLGIDLNRYKENLFKLYKRFHFHTEGKGLGLYLVKLQSESLGGRVEVNSELNKSTTFTIYLPTPENIEMQVLYDQPYARIFYDAKMNATGVKWFGPVTSEAYRKVFNKCLEFLLAYNTPNWISDISEQGPISLEDQQWMFKSILPQAVRNGLKRIAGIRPDAHDEEIVGYLNGIKATIAALNIEQAYFRDLQSAADWVMEGNERGAASADMSA